MADINYVSQKFTQAIHDIVLSAKPLTIRERVYTAASATGSLEPETFPAELRPDFQKFEDAVTRVEDEERGSYKASALEMEDDEAYRVLQGFLTLAYKVEELYHEQKSAA